MSDLRVGYGERIITPLAGTDLCGYGFYLDRKAESVLDDLKVRALFLRNGERNLIIVGCDLFGLSVEEADLLRQQVAAEHDVPAPHVLVACTHTHSGPAAQTLLGLGSVDRGFLKKLRTAVLEAAAEAAGDAQFAVFSIAFETLEPLGFNRQAKSFNPIDPVLKAAVFRRKDRTLSFLSYACHPVVLGPQKVVSADWPGAAIREIEKRGDRAVFLQGFCGDIDPVTQMNRWGQGTEDDLRLYGEIVGRRLRKAERYAAFQAEAPLAAVEERLALPLRIYGRPEIERRAKSFEAGFGRFPGAKRFAAEWRRRALERLPLYRRSPRLSGIPLQAVAVGPLRLLAVPGEPFCETGLALRKTWLFLMPVGSANGNVGYIPPRAAYNDTDDYACSRAAMSMTLFPFTSDVERIVTAAARRLLNALDR
jgi:neutral ceramidase